MKGLTIRKGQKIVIFGHGQPNLLFTKCNWHECNQMAHETVRYESDVRGGLIDFCLSCHKKHIEPFLAKDSDAMSYAISSAFESKRRKH